MNRRVIAPLSALLACAGLLTGCGSGSTQTVSVANTEASAPPITTTTTSSSATTTSTTTQSTTTSTVTSSSSDSTRTQSGPAFAQTTTSDDLATGVSSALAAHGYTPTGASDFNPQNTLQVVVGNRTGGTGEKAFFFVNGSYIGTDTSAASQSVSVVASSDTEVTLGYALVHPDGSPAGTVDVRYALNNGTLGPLDPIPSASPTAAVSRR
jgi:hypothetical protein